MSNFVDVAGFMNVAGYDPASQLTHAIMRGDDFAAGQVLAGRAPMQIADLLRRAGLDDARASRILQNAIRPNLGAFESVSQAALDRARIDNALAGVPSNIVETNAPPSGVKQIAAGFASSGNVTAGAQVTITMTPQVPFKTRSIWIPSNIGDAFTLDEVRLGIGGNLVTSESVPCLAFSEQSTGLQWTIGTVQVGQSLIMKFTNITGGAVKLRGLWWGTAVVPAGQ